MKLVASRLDRDVDHAARGPAHLGIVNITLHAELLRGFGGWNIGQITASGVGIVAAAVDLVFVSSGNAAADREIGDGAIIKRPRIQQTAGIGHARAQVHQGKWIVAVERQVVDLVAPDHLSHRAVALLEQRGFGRYGDLLRGAAELKRDIDLSVIVYVKFDGPAQIGLEARMGHLNLISTGLKIGDLIGARRIR